MKKKLSLVKLNKSEKQYSVKTLKCQCLCQGWKYQDGDYRTAYNRH